MRQQIGQGLTIALLAGVTFFYPLLAPIPHRIDEVHLKMIRNGMSLAEVESIFGVPPGEYDSAEWDHEALLEAFGSRQTYGGFQWENEMTSWRSPRPIEWGIWQEEQKRCKGWTSRHGSFSVYFDTNGLVRSTGYSNCVRVVPPWERLRRFLKPNQ